MPTIAAQIPLTRAYAAQCAKTASCGACAISPTKTPRSSAPTTAFRSEPVAPRDAWGAVAGPAIARPDGSGEVVGPDASSRPRRLEWAALLKRAWAIEVLTC